MHYLFVLILMPLLQLQTGSLVFDWFPKELQFYSIYFGILLQQLISLGLPMLLFYHNKKQLTKGEEFSFSFVGCFRFIFLGVMLQFVGTTLNAPLAILLQHWGFPAPKALPQAKNFLQFLMQTTAICLCPAILEELFFRKIVFGSIKKHSYTAAILISATLFSMAHFDFFNLPATFAVGIVLATARHRGTPLFYCIIAHFALNLSASVLNLLFENHLFLDLFNRYHVLFAILAGVTIALLFPKPVSTENTSENRAVFYWKKLCKNPSFYVYIIIFIVLGVRNLC